MLEQVLNYLNDYFIDTYCSLTEVESDGIIVTDVSQFIAGQYISIHYSKLNDGVYKVTSISGSKLTLEGSFSPEITTHMIVCSLMIPKVVLNITSEIETFVASNTNNVKSESLGDYSVSYAGSNDGDVSWVTVFAKRLNMYRKVYLQVPKKFLRIDRYYND